MRTIDELHGALTKLETALATSDGKAIMREIEIIGKEKQISSFTAEGEEAVRALGAQYGIWVCMNMPSVLKLQIKNLEEKNKP